MKFLARMSSFSPTCSLSNLKRAEALLNRTHDIFHINFLRLESRIEIIRVTKVLIRNVSRFR